MVKGVGVNVGVGGIVGGDVSVQNKYVEYVDSSRGLVLEGKSRKRFVGSLILFYYSWYMEVVGGSLTGRKVTPTINDAREYCRRVGWVDNDGVPILGLNDDVAKMKNLWYSVVRGTLSYEYCSEVIRLDDDVLLLSYGISRDVANWWLNITGLSAKVLSDKKYSVFLRGSGVIEYVDKVAKSVDGAMGRLISSVNDDLRDGGFDRYDLKEKIEMMAKLDNLKGRLVRLPQQVVNGHLMIVDRVKGSGDGYGIGVGGVNVNVNVNGDKVVGVSGVGGVIDNKRVEEDI